MPGPYTIRASGGSASQPRRVARAAAGAAHCVAGCPAAGGARCAVGAASTRPHRARRDGTSLACTSPDERRRQRRHALGLPVLLAAVPRPATGGDRRWRLAARCRHPLPARRRGAGRTAPAAGGRGSRRHRHGGQPAACSAPAAVRRPRHRRGRRPRADPAGRGLWRGRRRRRRRRAARCASDAGPRRLQHHARRDRQPCRPDRRDRRRSDAVASRASGSGCEAIRLHASCNWAASAMWARPAPSSMWR